MIPSVVAEQLRRGLIDYVETTFPFANEPFRSSFSDYLNRDKSLCLEPYTAIRLPFKSSTSMPTCFDAVQPAFLPYVHQQQAFDRLAGDDGRSTLVATGTGSGKTECFLYPLIDYCYRHRNERGIKAIIVYPMNALASDQAGRIAQLIYGNDKLRDNVTAGLYVGGLTWSEGVKVMTEDGIITDRETMIANPPDILLTNYKMLDYLLMRPHDSQIWKDNHPDTLKYIAVDEMHTFDGAQGTDLACLIRRMKSRLSIQPGYLCCVGTSATMGGTEAADGMVAYARELFGEPFDKDSVIQESRQTCDEFIAGAEPEFFALPGDAEAEELRRLLLGNNYEGYLKAAVAAFFEEEIFDALSLEGRRDLAQKLKAHALFQAIIQHSQGSYYRPSEMIDELGTRFPQLAQGEGAVILDALAALVSHARTLAGEKPRPFLNVQVQLWSKELRRLVASVGTENIDFDIAINLSAERGSKFLPVINCRDCRQTAWAGISSQNKRIAVRNLAAFYNTFFGDGDNVVAIYPRTPGEETAVSQAEHWYCPECGRFEDSDQDAESATKTCPECDSEMIPVSLAELERTTKAGTSLAHAKQYRCPCCGSDQGLVIMGLRDTTESEVLLSQLFASGFDSDVRTLVFSDNVQDASHRAGFFNGRTWKFGLRTAMLEYLESAGGRLSVADFQAGFADYWSSRMTDEEFVARFIAPGNMWMREYEKLVDTGSLSGTRDTARLLQTIKERMSYEVLLEIGMRSHIGRTLEKSAAIAVEFDHDAVHRAALAIAEMMENERGANFDVEQAEHFVIDLLQKLRAEGAFDEPSVYDRFILKGANAYMLNHAGLDHMPSLRASGIPRFPLVSGFSKRGFLSFGSPELGRIALKSLPEQCATDASLEPELVRAALRACYAQGLLVKIAEESQLCSYAINKDAVFISVEAVRFSCDTCGRSLVRAQGNLSQVEGAPCPSSFCDGHIHESEEQGLDYYGHLFSGGLRSRVQAKEHTGLLKRTAREEVEREFKATSELRKPWYPNVLSCTPTLEMGIDIGDLSSLIMCGMPPGQAQFLQRAGRAGRRDGNALSAVVANANPHGMYFYDEPREMLEGNVDAPRVFLEAGAVLERQFTAYCIDRWTKETKDEGCVPNEMFKPLQNMAAAAPDEAKFPFNLLGYVKTHTNQLVNSFLQMFSGDFSTDSEVALSLKAFAAGDAGSGESRLHVKIYDAFFARKKLREFYQDQKAVIDEVIRELKSHPADSSYEEQINEHEIEKRTIGNVIKSINSENVFGFMSREGLLPNYAFPEEGANLRVVLRRKKEDLEQDGSKWERETQEFSRSASAAISEFAPGNTFYANGHHYQVDQIDLSSAKEEEWRLCPECSHAERITPNTPAAACPKCHSTGWADKAQRRKMLKLATVVSNVDYNESLSDDSSDAREVTFFTKQLLVEVDERRDVVRAYKVKSDDIDFGFEYVKRAMLREINYGPTEAGTAQESMVAGESCIRSGFKVCMKCGKVQIPGAKENHSYFCDVTRGKASHEDAVEECLFLYREFETEAVRMLIPETTAVDITEGIVESFKAAVFLGLKKKFGNVDHLSMAISEEPVPESGFRKRYLVIFDSVPGGTGYLKQLVRDGKEFMSILQLAYDAMSECGCKDDPNRDGCYRCLYAYRQSNNIGSISRHRAMDVLGAILASEDLEEVACLDEVSVNNLFDSELEKLFVDALSGMKGPDGKTTKCMREVVNGKPGYSLKIGESLWEIEPQVELGPADGVSVQCKPDFVFWPVALGQNDERKPIAVFTDGFEFHKKKAADDTLKREAICRSARFHVWSLSYKDVESAIKGTQGDYYLNLFRIPELPTESIYNGMIAGKAGGFAPEKETPFSMLAWYLGHEDAERVFQVHADAYSLGMTVVNTDLTAKEFNAEHCIELAEVAGMDFSCSPDDLAFAGCWRPGEHLGIFGASSQKDAGDFHGTFLFAVLDDSDVDDIAYQRQWNGCLNLYNLMQFFWGFAFISKSGLENNGYERLSHKIPFEGEGAIGDVATASAWDHVVEEMLGVSEGFVKQLEEAGIPVPDEVGYELDSGEQADLAWLSQKACFLSSDLLDDKEAFERVGWTVIDESWNLDEVKSLFGGK